MSEKTSKTATAKKTTAAARKTAAKKTAAKKAVTHPDNTKTDSQMIDHQISAAQVTGHAPAGGQADESGTVDGRQADKHGTIDGGQADKSGTVDGGQTDERSTIDGRYADASVRPAGRLAVRKTYKLYIGGAFPRSESGRSYQVTSARGTFLANAALASRKDARDAVKAARSAFGGWSGATAYNRGQILYRIAEMLEGRREQFAAEVAAVEGVTERSALAQVDAAIDRWVWYAGWADKISQVRGTVNPVAGPYWNVSSPEPTGVVAVFAPERPSLFGLVSVLAPVIVSGNTAVLVAPDSAALPAVTLAEVLATSDLPGGVVNILTGRIAELGKPLAEHLDVDALDLAGVADADFAVELERAGAQNLKRLRRPVDDPDWTADPGLDRIVSFLETKTVWHPVGV